MVSSFSAPDRFTSGRLASVVVSFFAVLVCAMSAHPAHAALTITSFTASTASNVAGAHSDGTATFTFQTTLDGHNGLIPTGGSLRDVRIKLPPGLIGIAQNVPQCPIEAYRKQECLADTQVGAGSVTTGRVPLQEDDPHIFEVEVFNLATSFNQAVVLGLQIGVHNPFGQQLITATAHAADNYAVTLSAPETPRPFGAVVLGASITLWGVPADPSHDPLRACNGTDDSQFGCASEAPPLPFLENPTDCSETPLTSFAANTYGEPEAFTEASFTAPIPTGCQTVPFAPSLSVTPESMRAGVPTGLEVDLSVPQNQAANGQGSSELRSAVVALPPGMVISPSAASNGLEGCSDEQFGAGSDSPATCPPASQIGTAEVITQLLAGPFTGKLYLGSPLSNDPTSGQMFRIFVELKGFGQDVKLKGSVVADPVTGQLTATFANLPELPFNEARMRVNGGPNAPITNPTTCGLHTTSTALYPYSNPAISATPSSMFPTSYDGAGAPCPTALPFAPSSSLSTASSQAGATSPLMVTFGRADETQPLGRIDARLPAGLLGYVSKVRLCEAPQAPAGTCSPESRIGTVSTVAGAGSDPLTVQGSVYLARGTNGYPFMLSVVVPAVAGPYDLGNVVVPVWLQVNSDGSLTALSGPLPSILDGIPLDVRSVTMTLDRPGFTFNPTNCDQLAMSGTVTSLSGTVAPISTPFQASGCGGLPFAPSFTAATQGSTSKANGASLAVRIAQKPGEANIHSVHVELPIQLPSRLTTLQRACTEAQFASNPAGCPAGSVVGSAVAYTPTLSSPLSGPAILVSHGGAAFPDLEIILQGEGVTVILDGQTDIKRGITSSTFASAPDVPLSGFELTLPEGPDSLLGANRTMCTSRLLMPTTIVGWNGLAVKQSTRIAVSGCPKVKVVSAKVKGATASLTVRAPAAGSLTVSGSGLKQAHMTLKRAGNATVTVGPTTAGLASLHHHHNKLRIEVRVSFTSSKGPSSSASTTLTFR
jgi:hypothetical protein